MGQRECENVSQLCQAIMERLDSGESERGFRAQETIQAYGMSWSKKQGSLMIKIPLHPELQELYEKNESANVNGARCNALCVPRALIGSSTEQKE